MVSATIPDQADTRITLKLSMLREFKSPLPLSSEILSVNPTRPAALRRMWLGGDHVLSWFEI